MATEAKTSWWDRRPWVGAILFAVVVSAVGAFLAVMVGERPHMRGAWSLVTEYRRGSYEKGSAWSEDPVRVVIRVRVHDEDYQGIAGAQVALVTRDLRTVSRGFTGEPEGHIHLPVPERFSKSIFEGTMRIHVFQPGAAPAIAEIPMPKEGLVQMQVPLENVRTVRVSVEEADGSPVRKRGGVVTTTADGTPHLGVAPWPLDRGVTTIAGLPRDSAVRLEATVAGHAPTVTTVEPSARAATLQTGIELARLAVAVRNPDGTAQASSRLRVRVSDGREKPVSTVKTDREGVLRLAILPGDDRRVIIRDGARRAGTILEPEGPLAPGQRWRPKAATLTPYPRLVSGTVMIDGEPAPSILVTVRAWGRGGGAETATTDDRGRFEVSGLDTGEPILVTAFKGGLVGRSDAVAPGSQDVVVTAAPAGIVKGRVHAAPAAIEAGVLVGAVPAGTRKRGAALQAAHVERDGSFKLEALPAGVYDIVAWTGETTAPSVIERVTVLAGKTVTDPRLDMFEL